LPNTLAPELTEPLHFIKAAEARLEEAKKAGRIGGAVAIEPSWSLLRDLP